MSTGAEYACQVEDEQQENSSHSDGESQHDDPTSCAAGRLLSLRHKCVTGNLPGRNLDAEALAIHSVDIKSECISAGRRVYSGASAEALERDDRGPPPRGP